MVEHLVLYSNPPAHLLRISSLSKDGRSRLVAGDCSIAERCLTHALQYSDWLFGGTSWSRLGCKMRVANHDLAKGKAYFGICC